MCFSGLVVGFGGGFIVVPWVGCLGVLLVYLSDFLVGLVLWLCLVVGCFRVVVWNFGFWCFLILRAGILRVSRKFACGIAILRLRECLCCYCGFGLVF